MIILSSDGKYLHPSFQVGIRKRIPRTWFTAHKELRSYGICHFGEKYLQWLSEEGPLLRSSLVAVHPKEGAELSQQSKRVRVLHTLNASGPMSQNHVLWAI